LARKDGGPPEVVQCGEAQSLASGGITLHRKLEDMVKMELEHRTGNPGFLESCGDAQNKSIGKACIRIIHESDGLGKGDGRITFHQGVDRGVITIKR